VRPGILAETSERHLDYIILSARLPRVALLAKRMARRDNQVRALINLAGRRELERLPQPTTAPVNLSMEIKGPKNRRLHPGHNNSGAIFTAAPEKIPEPFFVQECGVLV
jgi:hypothetical protein